MPASLLLAVMSPALYLAAKIGWPDVALALVVSLPGLLAAIFAGLNHRNMKTPSGARLGVVAEKTHDLTAVATMKVDKVLNGEGQPPHASGD